jgi:hypothetical protein
MKAAAVALSFLVSLFVLNPFVGAQELHYLGKFAGRQAGLIRMSGQHYEVTEGTVIPGWGSVKMMTDGHLILHIVLSEADKQELARQGAAVYDILQIEIPHENLRLVPFGR